MHPNLASTQHTFAKDVLSLLATCEDMGNPFIEDNGDMLTLDTKVVMNKDAIRTVNAVEDIGQRQFSESVEDWLNIASNKPLGDSVSKNKIGAVQYTSNHAEVKKHGTSRIFEDKLYSILSFLHCLQS